MYELQVLRKLWCCITAMRKELHPLPEALAKKAAVELNERPNDVPYYLDTLKKWLMTQPHLRSRTQDQFLIAFLRGSKFSLEKCKQKIDSFYTCRGMLPELFRNRNASDPEVYKILRLGAMLHLPKPVADDGPRVTMLRPGFIDFHNYTCIDVFKVGTMMADLCLYEDSHALVAGYILIMDVANVTPFHLFHFDPMFVKKLTVGMNKASPSRLKGFHFINMLPAYEKCFNMVKGAVNEKLRNRFYFHGNDLESLYKHVPKHCLPAEYGGKSETVQDIIDVWERKIKKNKQFFIEEEAFGCDEKLRDGKAVTEDSLFGTEGSFRQLAVD